MLKIKMHQKMLKIWMVQSIIILKNLIKMSPSSSNPLFMRIQLKSMALYRNTKGTWSDIAEIEKKHVNKIPQLEKMICATMWKHNRYYA